MGMIAKELGILGISTYTGKSLWHLSAVRNVLENTAYIGYLYYNKSICHSNSNRTPRDKTEWIKIVIPAIIDESTFNFVQRKIKDQRETLRRRPLHFYLLSGMVRCAECKKPYRANFKKARPKENRRANSSYRHRLYDGQCMDKEISAHRLDDLVWDKISEMLMKPEVLREGYEQAKHYEQINRARTINLIQEMYKAANKLEQQLMNLTRAYTDPEIQMTKTQYLAQKGQFEGELREIQDEIKEIEPQATDLPTPNQLEELESFAEKIRGKLANENWEPTPESKRHLLQMLHVKVFISKDGTARVTGWFGETDGFSYTRRLRSARLAPRRARIRCAARPRQILIEGVTSIMLLSISVRPGMIAER